MTFRDGCLRRRASRGEPVVKDILDATRKELARVGYRALRIEDVAALAHVHKTTIYRRWPSKVELVRETLEAQLGEAPPMPNTGSLRGDLLAVAEHMRMFLCAPDGQMLVRMMMAEGADGELRQIIDSLRCDKEALPTKILENAIARSEIRKDVHVSLLIMSIMGALHHLMFLHGRTPERADLEEIVDLVLYGATPR